MGKARPKTRRSQQGFTLTELLVASAIFLILSTALVTLFTSAVHSVRAGYASIDAYEQGRIAMSTMTRDLTGAFTAREHGDVYNFYGRPDGFMFVGALDEGQIGRVTYAFHPEAGKPPYQTTIRMPWAEISANVHRQASRIFRDAGLSGANVSAGADNVVADLVNEYEAVPGNGIAPTDIVELNVLIETESLIRYEERGVTDLDHFNMTVTAPGAAPVISLDWPYVDPIDPNRDGAVASADGSVQQAFLLSAINPDPSTTTYDLRNMYADINVPTGSAPCPEGGWQHPLTGACVYLRVLGRDTFEQVLNARKREFWIRMLSGESMGLGELTRDSNPEAQNGAWGFWYDESFNAANGNARQRRIVNEYVVADGIIARAVIFDIDFGAPMMIGATGVPMDALDADVRFSYGDGSNAPVNYFNAIENLRDPDNPDGTDALPTPPNPPDGVFDSLPLLVSEARLNGDLGGSYAILQSDLVEADGLLADNLLGNRSSRKNLGSPLAPRIPEVVTPQLWVTRSKRSAGAADFRRLFVQSIQIPAATGRRTNTTIALGPGGAL